LECFKESKIRNTIYWKQNGVEAMKFLQQQDTNISRLRADLILLDLNMPMMDGMEVLAKIKSDEALKRIPVIIFTISKADEHILKAYNLRANCYITKPIDLNKFMMVIRSIEEFWLTTVRLPEE